MHYHSSSFAFFFILCLVLYCRDTESTTQQDWAPFDYLKARSSLSKKESKRFNPYFKVQSYFGDGLGWKSMHAFSRSNAFHVVISLVGTDPKSKMEIPLQSVSLQVKSSVPCIMERGNGYFEECHLDQNQEFITNPMGRISFSIPTDNWNWKKSFPPLLISSKAIDSTIIAHFDVDLFSKLSKLSWVHLKENNFGLHDSKLKLIHTRSRYLFKDFTHASPHRGLLKRHSEANPLQYDERLNFIPLFSLDSTSTNTSLDALKSPLFHRRYPSRIYKRGNHVFTTLEEAWTSFVKFVGKMGLIISKFVNTLVSLFKWNEISPTVQFLSIYYRQLAALSVHGLDIARSKYLDLLHNVSSQTNDYFAHKLDKLGVTATPFDSFFDQKEDKKVIMNGQTAMIQDRVLNYLPEMKGNASLFQKLTKVFKTAANSLETAVDIEEWKRIIQNPLLFGNQTLSFQQKGYAHLLNSARILTVGTEHIVGNIYASLLEFQPLYWALAQSFLMTPIHVPFLTEFWNEKMFYNQSTLSLLDMLCLLGGVYASWYLQISNSVLNSI